MTPETPRFWYDMIAAVLELNNDEAINSINLLV
jgi:hypothetical protein